MTTLTPDDRDRLRALADEYDDSTIDGGPDMAAGAIRQLLDMLGQAEQRIRDLTQEVQDERAACLDQIEQVQARDARIKAEQDHARAQVDRVRDVLDRARDEFEQPDEADIRRALDGDR